MIKLEDIFKMVGWKKYFSFLCVGKNKSELNNSSQTFLFREYIISIKNGMVFLFLTFWKLWKQNSFFNLNKILVKFFCNLIKF